MSILAVVLPLILIGVVMYLVMQLVPMDARIKTLITCIVIIAVLLWVMQQFGIIHGPAIHL